MSKPYQRNKPMPNEIWEHYKGEQYNIVGVAVEERTMNLVVVYQSFEENAMWTRPYEEFMGKVKTQEMQFHVELKDRFIKIQDAPREDVKRHNMTQLKEEPKRIEINGCEEVLMTVDQYNDLIEKIESGGENDLDRFLYLLSRPSSKQQIINTIVEAHHENERHHKRKPRYQ